MSKAVAKIAQQIEAQVKKETGAVVEWTFRDAEHFTVSGEAAEVTKATDFIVAQGIARLESVDYDDDLGESFAYLVK